MNSQTSQNQNSRLTGVVRRATALLMAGGLLAAAGFALLSPTSASADGPATALAGTPTTAAACADDDYHCWKKHFKDIFADITKDSKAQILFVTTLGSDGGTTAVAPCADNDYDCWKKYYDKIFADIFGKPGTNSGGADDLSGCILGIDFAGEKCVEDHLAIEAPRAEERRAEERRTEVAVETRTSLVAPTPPAGR